MFRLGSAFRRRFWLLAACVASLACSLLEAPAQQDVERTYPVSISIYGDGRQPLAGVELLDQKRVLGKTNATGTVNLKLKGSEGTTASLTVKCPPSFKSPDKPIVIGLRHMSAESPAPKFEAECIPLARTVVVGLRAENGAGLNIVRLNQVVGRTDAQGIAHVLLEAAPGEHVTLTINTADKPNLRPQSPALTFVAADRNELVLLEQKFTVLKPVIRVKPRTIPKPL